MSKTDPSEYKTPVESLRAALTDALSLEATAQRDALAAVRAEAQIEIVVAIDRLTAAIERASIHAKATAQYLDYLTDHLGEIGRGS